MEFFVEYKRPVNGYKNGLFLVHLPTEFSNKSRYYSYAVHNSCFIYVMCYLGVILYIIIIGCYFMSYLKELFVGKLKGYMGVILWVTGVTLWFPHYNSCAVESYLILFLSCEEFILNRKKKKHSFILKILLVLLDNNYN